MKELENDLAKVVGHYKSDPNVLKIILFGSCARGTCQPDSDIDLAVVYDKLPSRRDIAQYKNKLELSRDFDIVPCTKEALAEGRFVLRYVRDEGKVIYERVLGICPQ